MSHSNESLPLRRLVCSLLITVIAAAVAGRILAVVRVYEPQFYREKDDPDETRGPWPEKRPRPMSTIGANDRSRWATVRALVDDGTYAIGHRDPSAATPDNPYGDVGIVFEDGWQTIDKVFPPGQPNFYSSKPPLLPTLLAGEYWLL
jgi:hypothetical protein